MFLSIYIDLIVQHTYDGDGRWDIQVTSSALSTNVNTTRVSLVGGCWRLSLPEIVGGNLSSMYHLPILLIKFRTNNPLRTYHKINSISIHSILNKFEKIANGEFKLSTLDKRKLQDDLIKELTLAYSDKILRVNKL